MTKILLGLLGAVLAVGVAEAQVPSFEALGQAPVVAGDRVRARERALEEALRQAVEQAVGTVLTPDQVIARSSDLRLRIYPQARSYVGTYRVLDEGEVNGLYQVHLSAEVSTGRLAHDLAGSSSVGALPRSGTRPRVVACAQVRVSGELGAAEAELAARGAQALRELLSERGAEALPSPGECTEAAASAVAHASGARGALLALVTASPGGPIRGTDKVAAHVEARLEWVEPDGRISAAFDAARDAYDSRIERAAASAGADALADAGQKIEPTLAARFVAQKPAGAVTVRLAGVERFADYQAVAHALGALPGVASVEPRRFGDREIDLLVHTAQPAGQLAAALSRLPPPGLRVAVRAASDGGLQVVVDGPDPASPPPG